MAGVASGLTDRPDYPIVLVHNSLTRDQIWNIAVRSVQVISPDNNGFPFWSLQLADLSQRNLGVLTASLFPGRSEIGLSYTEVLAGGVPSVKTTYVSYAEAPYCRALSVRLEYTTPVGIILVAYSNCGTGTMKKEADFGINATLAPASVRYGKLSADRGPDGSFIFSFDPFSNVTSTSTQRPR